jgi:hypothetical protein
MCALCALGTEIWLLFRLQSVTESTRLQAALQVHRKPLLRLFSLRNEIQTVDFSTLHYYGQVRLHRPFRYVSISADIPIFVAASVRTP